MKIIGKLIKKTTEISYKIGKKKTVDFSNQLITLINLLRKAKDTKFGKTYEFSSILNDADFITRYQDLVPIFDYNDFYENWLKYSLEDKENIIWPGKIKYYALSSGTTGAPSKKIPVTNEMIKFFQKTSMAQVTILHELNLNPEIYSKSILTVGGSTKLNKVGEHYEGDLSGILKKNTKWIVSPLTKPSSAITELKDWNTKMKLITEKAPDWDISVIAGIPSWCIMLMENIVKEYKLNNIHEMWPNLSVYVHGGVYVQPYLNRIEKISGKKIHLLDTYLASEGYFAYQKEANSNGMKILMDKGIFYEFVPFNSSYFDANGNLLNKHRAFTINEVKENVDYAIVISTNAGLWRYLLGDTVKFTNIEKKEIIISGRIKQYLSLVGEHLTLDNINEVITRISNEFQIQIDEFTIFADQENYMHKWYLGTDRKINETELTEKLDSILREINDDYNYVRKYNLNIPVVKILPSSMFYNFMERQGRLGAQNKFPRVLNNNQAQNWVDFIHKMES